MPAAKYKGLYWDPERLDRRRVAPAKRKAFEVATMWERHHEIARLAILGMKHGQIAEALHICRATVSFTLNSKVVKDKMAVLRAARDVDAIDLSHRIQEFAPKCLAYLEKVISGEEGANVHLRAKESNNWLDRAGYSPVKKSMIATARVSPERLERIKDRARQQRLAAEALR